MAKSSGDGAAIVIAIGFIIIVVAVAVALIAAVGVLLSVGSVYGALMGAYNYVASAAKHISLEQPET